MTNDLKLLYKYVFNGWFLRVAKIEDDVYTIAAHDGKPVYIPYIGYSVKHSCTDWTHFKLTPNGENKNGIR